MAVGMAEAEVVRVAIVAMVVIVVVRMAMIVAVAVLVVVIVRVTHAGIIGPGGGVTQSQWPEPTHHVPPACTPCARR